jgi:hypothetical protein
MRRPRLVGVLAALAMTAPTAVLATPALADVPTTTLHVGVHNETHCCSPIAGATVVLYNATTGAQVGSTGTSTTSGVDFSVTAGTYTAKVSKAGFVTEYSTMTTVTADDVTNSTTESTSVGLNVPSADFGKAHGKLTVNGQKPSDWSGYGWIYAYDATTGNVYTSTYFNGYDDGQWGMKLPPSGFKFKLQFYDYTLSSWRTLWAGGADYNSAGTFTVTAKGDITVPAFDLTRAAASPTQLTGKVTNSAGKGLDGVIVYLISSTATNRWAIITQTTTDSTGTYAFAPGLADGAYRIWFNDYDGEYLDAFYAGGSTPITAQDDSVPAGATSVTLSAATTTAATVALTKGTVPAQTSGITGLVTDDAGNPLHGARVVLYNNETGNDISTYTGRDGSWRIAGEQLPPGSYTADVTVNDPGYDDVQNLTMVLPNHGVSNRGTIKLARRGTIKGTVSHVSHPEEAYTWADLNLYDLDGRYVDGTSSDSAGRYEFDNVTAGAYYLEVVAAGSYDLYDSYHGLIPAFFGGGATLATARPISVSPARTVTANLALTSKLSGRGAAISGTAIVGRTLTAKTGTWSRKAGTSFSYAWKVGAKVVGTKASYRVAAADAGQTLTLTVTAANPNWDAGSLTVSTKAVSAAVAAAQAKVDATNAAIAKANTSLKAAKKAKNKAAIAKAKAKIASLKKKLRKQKADLAKAQKAAK